MLSLFRSFFSLKKHPVGGGWWYFSPRSNRKIVLGVSFFIHGWKEHFFFITVEVPWGFEVAWHTPRTDLNRHVSLVREEEESLAYLLQCSTSASDLLREETLVNAGLSPTEPTGNSRLALALFSLHRQKYRFETNHVLFLML